MHDSKKGFTLIELLVVIAIIGLFAAIVLASLSSARSRSQVAAIKSELKSAQNQAALAYDNTGDYSTASSAVSAIITGINKAGGTATFYTYDNTRFAVSAVLNSDPTKMYSITSDGGVVVWDTTDWGPSVWHLAVAYCTNKGERLPTIEELKALYLAGGTSIFSANRYYWSGDGIYDPINPDRARSLWTYDGSLGNNNGNNIYSRCVH